MLLANDKFARSILNEDANRRLAQVSSKASTPRHPIRDMETKTRIPHYLIPPNTPLPTIDSAIWHGCRQSEARPPGDRRERHVARSALRSAGRLPVDGLPPNLPEGSKIDVTISYDPQATVHVSAKDAASGKSAHTEILRQNIVAQLTSDPRVSSSDSVVLAEANPNPFKKTGPAKRPGSAFPTWRTIAGRRSSIRRPPSPFPSATSADVRSTKRESVPPAACCRPGEEQTRSGGEVTHGQGACRQVPRGQVPCGSDAEPAAARAPSGGRETGSQAPDAGNAQASVRPTAAKAAVFRAAQPQAFVGST